MEPQYITEINTVLYRLMWRGGLRTLSMFSPINPTSYPSVSGKAQNSAKYSSETMSQPVHRLEILSSECPACCQLWSFVALPRPPHICGAVPGWEPLLSS